MTLEFQYRSRRYVIPLKYKLTYIQGNSATGKSTLRSFVDNPITYVNVPCDLVSYSQLSDMLRLTGALNRDTVVIIDESEAEYIRKNPGVLREARSYFEHNSEYKLYWIVIFRFSSNLNFFETHIEAVTKLVTFNNETTLYPIYSRKTSSIKQYCCASFEDAKSAYENLKDGKHCIGTFYGKGFIKSHGAIAPVLICVDLAVASHLIDPILFSVEFGADLWHYMSFEHFISEALGITLENSYYTYKYSLEREYTQSLKSDLEYAKNSKLPIAEDLQQLFYSQYNIAEDSCTEDCRECPQYIPMEVDV